MVRTFECLPARLVECLPNYACASSYYLYNGARGRLGICEMQATEEVHQRYGPWTART